MAACEFKACPREAVWQYPDINERVMVCLYHAQFMDEENGEFDSCLRDSFSEHTGSTSEWTRHDLHFSEGVMSDRPRLWIPRNRRLVTVSHRIENFCDVRAQRRRRQREREDFLIAQAVERREVRQLLRAQRIEERTAERQRTILANAMARQLIRAERQRYWDKELAERIAKNEVRLAIVHANSKWGSLLDKCAALSVGKSLTVPKPPEENWARNLRAIMSQSKRTYLQKYSIRDIGIAVQIAQVGNW